MAAPIPRNLIYNHRVLNHLSASYQGKFAELNILSQLEHSSFSPDQIKKVKTAIVAIRGWLDSIISGHPLMSEENPFQNTLGKQILSALQALQDELPKYAIQIKSILVSEDQADLKDTVAALIAAYGRNAYARDNYLRGFIKFYRTAEDNETADSYQEALADTSLEIQNVGDFVQVFRGSENLERSFVEHIRFFSRILPGIFQSQAHDIRQLIIGPRTLMGFDDAGFLKPEAADWRAANFEALEAGYWRAHEIASEEAMLWKAVNVNDPLIAAEWKTAGFDPPTASLWMDVKFSPLLAIQWHNLSFPPSVALEYVKQGYQSPADLPPEVLAALFPNSTAAASAPIPASTSEHPGAEPVMEQAPAEPEIEEAYQAEVVVEKPKMVSRPPNASKLTRAGLFDRDDE